MIKLRQNDKKKWVSYNKKWKRVKKTEKNGSDCQKKKEVKRKKLKT